MRQCGCRYLSGNLALKVRRIYADSTGITVFWRRLNTQGIGGERLRLENEDIIAAYDKCYYGLAKSAKNYAHLLPPYLRLA